MKKLFSTFFALAPLFTFAETFFVKFDDKVSFEQIRKISKSERLANFSKVIPTSTGYFATLYSFDSEDSADYLLNKYKTLIQSIESDLEFNIQEIMKKNNTWNIRRLVLESFVPATQRIILKIVGFLYACIAVGLCAYKSLFQL